MKIKIEASSPGLWHLTLSEVENPQKTLEQVSAALRPWADVPDELKRTRAILTKTDDGVGFSRLPTLDALFHATLVKISVGGLLVGMDELVQAANRLTSVPGWSGNS